MNPPIFQICAADPAVTALITEGGITRLWPFDKMPRSQEKKLPYVVWQIVTGFPENYMDQAPDIDQYTLQVDVYAKRGSTARQVVEALRDAIEPHAHISSWHPETTDPDTKHKRFGFDVDWYVPR